MTVTDQAKTLSDHRAGLETRRGRFLLPSFGITGYPLDEQRMKECMTVLAHVAVVRAEALLMEQAIEYYGYSMLFDPIPLGHRAPTYKLAIVNDSTVSAERVD